MTDPSLRTIESLPAEMIDAIRRDSEHFPAHVRNRGREYLMWGRVGPLEIEDGLVRATVRGSRRYRTAWRWDGEHVDPLCTCPVGPLCKHAYALARAVVVAWHERTPVDDGSPGPHRVGGAEPRTAPAAAAGPGRSRSARPDPDVESLRAAFPHDRARALARLLWRAHDHGVYLTPYDFRDLLDEPDPDLLCWRLAHEIGRRTGGWVPRGLVAYRDRADLEARAAERTRAEMAQELASWARSHAMAPTRMLRAVFGLLRNDQGVPAVTVQALATSTRLRDEPRTPHQIMQLASDLRRDPSLLAPPQARLLRVLAASFSNTAWDERGTMFEPSISGLNRLLDSLADSPVATWDEIADAELRARAGVAAGDRVRLGEAILDVLPVCVRDDEGMRVALAARWPDGRQLRLEEIVYLPADDGLHPSLVLADGRFWRVGEEPPRELLVRFQHNRSLPVPEHGRESFLELLASSFSSVADALAPHTRVHPARALVALAVRDSDWLHVRLFAHTGGEAWRPGSGDAGTVGFEFTPNLRWERLDDRGGSIEPPEGLAPVEAAGDRALEPDGSTISPKDDAAAEPEDIWLETPDPERIRPARAWLESLPVARGDVRGPGGTGPDAPDAHVGWWMRINARNLERFAESWESRPHEVTWLGNREMRELLSGARQVRPSLHVTASGVDFFAVSADWEAEGLGLSADDLAKLREARTRFVRLKGGWVRRETIEAYDAAAGLLADLGVEAGEGEQRVSLLQLAQARPESLAALGELGADASTLRAIEDLRRRVREFRGLPHVDPPAGLTAELRPYQRDGLDFLTFVTDLGMGAVLADDMGLGKTVQALAWLERMREADPGGGPALVVCPASVVHNWQRESERFTPGLRILALTSGQERHALRREIPDHDLLITNYALLRRDLAQWQEVPLRAAILDEAQFIKNPDAAVSRAVLQLRARHRIALTGTPLENRALDLWSIMQFLNPGYLGHRKAFVARYDRPDAPPHARRLLSAKLRPVLLRRLKAQVAPELPERIEERRDCELTRGQRQLYLAERARCVQIVEDLSASPDGVRRNKIQILAALTRLRQVCCHPALVGGKAALGSGKFDALFELLEPLLAEGHKVLLFSQFVECLKLLEEDLKARAIRHHLLTGATTRREAVVNAFEQDPEPCVFLISLKAGGTGLNLTAASYVVLFDPWWNPAVEAQAIDRTHRIGQTRTVIAFRMLTEGTIEEKIWELQQRKAALVRDVLGEDGFARTLTRGDLDYLLADDSKGGFE